MSPDEKHDEPGNDALRDNARPATAHDAEEKVFKSVMRKLAGTACIIATSSEDGLHGLTATAVSSVSAEPPRILIVVNRSSRTHPHIHAKQAFSLNLLAEDQQAIAELFATKSSDQFTRVEYKLLDDSCPVIVGSAAHLHCRIEQQFDVGTHTIFIGGIIGGGVSDARPLVYQDAAFWTLKPSAE